MKTTSSRLLFAHFQKENKHENLLSLGSFSLAFLSHEMCIAFQWIVESLNKQFISSSVLRRFSGRDVINFEFVKQGEKKNYATR